MHPLLLYCGQIDEAWQCKGVSHSLLFFLGGGFNRRSFATPNAPLPPFHDNLCLRHSSNINHDISSLQLSPLLFSSPALPPPSILSVTMTTATLAPLSSFTNFPAEIILLILAQLDQPSLAVCVRVNSIWKELGTPLLWATLNINSGERLARFLTDEAQKALSRNAGYIQELTLKFLSIYNIFAPVYEGSRATHTNCPRVPQCTNLRRLELLQDHGSMITSDSVWEYGLERERQKLLEQGLDRAVAILIRQNPRLRELEIKITMSPETLLPLVTHDMPHLKVLACDFDLDQYIAKVLLEHLPESVRDICLYVRSQMTPGLDLIADTIRAQLQVQDLRQHHALESLKIAGRFRKAEQYHFLLPFLDTCRSPLTFHIGGNTWASEPQIRKAFSRVGFFLEKLETFNLDDGTASSDDEIAEYIRLSAHWRLIHLQNRNSVGPLTAAAILDNCECLQSLHLAGCGLLSSADIQSILSKATCLKNFMAFSYSDTMIDQDPFISAADFIALDWGSLSLEKFNCKIKVPRPDHDTHEVEESLSRSGSIAASRVIQRQVYQKLAAQTSLRTLQLGHCPSRNSSINQRRYQRQCLEMTLDSGLDELAGLRDLEWLHVGTMAQRIGVPELEWMAENWPLKFLQGLFETCVDPVPGAREWIRDSKPFWVYQSDLIWFEHHPTACSTSNRIFSHPSVRLE